MLKKAAILSIALMSFAVVAQAQNTTYNFVSDDGNPEGIIASITLDSPFSASGSPSDIVFFSVSDPYSAFTFSDVVSVLSDPGPMTWNASQITSMNVSGVGTASFPDLVFFNFEDTGISYQYDDFFNGDTDASFSDNGSWEAAASVPDVGSSAALLSLGMMGFGALRRFRW